MAVAALELRGSRRRRSQLQTRHNIFIVSLGMITRNKNILSRKRNGGGGKSGQKWSSLTRVIYTQR